MLQNTVAGVTKLNQVNVQSSHNTALGKKPLNYASYKDLLLSAATTYDAKRGLSKGRPQRNAYNIENIYDMLTDTDSSTNASYTANVHHISEQDDSVSHDIDTDILSLHVNQNERQHPRQRFFRPTMSKDRWDNLSKTEKDMWDKFHHRLNQ